MHDKTEETKTEQQKDDHRNSVASYSGKAVSIEITRKDVEGG